MKKVKKVDRLMKINNKNNRIDRVKYFLRLFSSQYYFKSLIENSRINSKDKNYQKTIKS